MAAEVRRYADGSTMAVEQGLDLWLPGEKRKKAKLAPARRKNEEHALRDRHPFLIS
jgi:hypothetical protein